ncbi:cytochrome P450 [Xylariomycetidae sp. FL2044]|nr:cytochrome P450 [Xylariomycetidae sp. FL2044]
MTSILTLLPGFSVLVTIGYLSYLLLQRCFLSPLANLPGPRLAALTYWYECYFDVFLPGQYAFKIKSLHQKYGPVVRIGPNDVSISDYNFIDVIYAPATGHKRDKNAKHNRALGVNSSIGGSVPHELHRRRREALNPFFSPHSIHRLDSDIAAKVAQVEGHFASARENGTVLNISDAYFAFCSDIVNQYCFGRDPNLLNVMQAANMRRNNVASVLRTVKMMFHFGWIRTLMRFLPGSSTGARDMIMFRRRVRADIDEVLARKQSPGETPSIFTHLRDSSDLPDSERSAQRLEDEGVLMTMAGTYSPMLSLVLAQYYLITRPDVMSNLRKELAAHEFTTAAAQLERLPYLSAIIQEAHRLSFGLTGRNPRICPDETIVYERDSSTGRAYAFPPGTSLSVSTLVLHTDESLFPDPWKFDPERWLISSDDGHEKDEDKNSLLLAHRRRAMLSFMRGSRVCIGRHLANAEMAALVAAMARWDLELFETDETDVVYKHDYHVMCPKLESKGVRVKVTGRWAGQE